MPAPLGVASSLFLYSVIPSVPFVGYSIVVPTVLSLQPVPDGCSPNILLYLLASYVLAYLFLLFSFSISLFPLPGFSCFHRLDVKLLSLSSLSLLHLLSLAHATIFLLLPAYAPDVLSSMVISASSSYMPAPLSSACTSAPTFSASLLGVAVQSFFLLWLLCTAVIALGQERCWAGWTEQELREIAEAQTRHAQWRAERDEERRKLLDGQWYKPAKAATQQRSEKRSEEQTRAGTTVLPVAQAQFSTATKLKEREEQNEQDGAEDEHEIVRYTEKIADKRRKEREKEEEKEQSDDVEDETEDEEEEDQQSEHSDVNESRSSSPSSSSSSSEAAVSEEEDGGSGESEEESEEQEEAVEVSRNNSAGKQRRKENEIESEHSEDESDNRQAEEEEAVEQPDEADEQPVEETSGKDDQDSEPSGVAYSDAYGGLASHAPTSRSSAAPHPPSTAATRRSAAPLSSPPLQKATAAVEEQKPASRRASQPIARTIAVKQPADIFGATVPLARLLPPPPAALSSTTTAALTQYADLPPLPPMPAFAATAPITIPASSVLLSPSPARPPAPAPSPTLPPPSATFSSHTPPLPIVAVPLRRPKLSPLSLQPPLPIAAGVLGRTTASPSPPLPISPLPLSPKAFLATGYRSHSPSPPPVASSPPLALSEHVGSRESVSAAPVAVLPAATVSNEIAAVKSSPPLPLPADTAPALVAVVHSPAASEPAEQQRQPLGPVHSQQELQLVAELQQVHEQRRQQQEQQQESEPGQPVDETKEQQSSNSPLSDAADKSSHHGPPHTDGAQPEQQQQQQQQQQHQQRLSDTGQFVVETSDGSSTVTEHEPIEHVSVDQPSRVVEDEISFSDDEDESGVVQPTHVDEQQAAAEQSVEVDEEVEEEVF